MITRILVPTDGSAAAQRALEQAGYRKQHTADDVFIVVLNVQVPLPPSRYVTRSMIRDHHAQASVLGAAVCTVSGSTPETRRTVLHAAR